MTTISHLSCVLGGCLTRSPQVVKTKLVVVIEDPNAAIKPSKPARSSSDSRNACGEENAGQGYTILVKLSSMKQEPDASYVSA